MSNKVLIINTENCTGCRMCELACSSIKTGLFYPEHSRIKVITNGLEGWSRPVVCVQCEDPSCVDACPVNAIYEKNTSNGEKIIDIDSNICTQCYQCVEACPFGAICLSNDNRIIKCDLCDGIPQCVEFCSYKCLDFNEIPEEHHKRRSNNIKQLILDSKGKIKELNPHQRRVFFSLDLARATSKTP